LNGRSRRPLEKAAAAGFENFCRPHDEKKKDTP
jgi:hypothetical protein